MAEKTPKNKVKKLDTIFIVLLSLILTLSVGGFLLLNNILAGSKEFNRELLDGVEPTILLDSDGNVYKELTTEDGLRENVDYEDVPQVVVDAFLAVEDSRFFKHNGFDLPRFFKSMLENLKAMGFAQGGSTLTMQMIDVTHTTTSQDQSMMEKVYGKIQEIFLAMDAESSTSKKEIFMKYLNYINFGGPARGIQKGASYYFGKDVSALNLSEAAFLAGVINSPNGYNPYYDYESATQRRNTTLDLMLYHGYITQAEHDLAIGTELAFQLNGAIQFNTAPYLSYIDKVAEEVKELTGKNIYEGNMIIQTYMDREAQDLADAILNGEGGVNFPVNDELFQTGFALVDNSNLGIVALGGGRGYDGDDRLSRAFGVQHQTGSSIKPIMEYCLTFDYLGWATSHILADVPMYYAGTNIPLGNADGQYRGDVTFESAVANSWNTTAVQALQDVVDVIGVNRVIEHMQKLGFIKFFPDTPYAVTSETFSTGLGIGGSEMTSTPLEMAGAYATFANGGNFTRPHAVKSIEYRDGSEEAFTPTYESVNVITPQAAYLMSTILEKTVSSSYANLQQIMKSSYKVYAKTGTSDWADQGIPYGIPETAMKDKWLISYTSKYTAAAWAGYDEPVAGKNTYFDNTKMLLNVPGQICRKLFDLMHTDNYPADLQMPSGIVTINHVLGAYDGGYYAVPDGTPADLSTSGLIKSEYASLKGLAADPVANLDSFTAQVNKDTKQVDFSFSAYPELEATIPFDGVYHGVDRFPDFSGHKIFSKTAIFGEIVYRVKVLSNGIELGSFDFDKESGSSTFNIIPGDEVSLCATYAYKNSGVASNSVCVVLTARDTRPLGGGGDSPSDPDNPDDPTDEPSGPTEPDGPDGPWDDPNLDNEDPVLPEDPTEN